MYRLKYIFDLIIGLPWRSNKTKGLNRLKKARSTLLFDRKLAHNSKAIKYVFNGLIFGCGALAEFFSAFAPTARVILESLVQVGVGTFH